MTNASYCTVEELRENMRSDRIDNSQLAPIIVAASRLVDGYCGISGVGFSPSGTAATDRIYPTDMGYDKVRVDWFYTSTDLAIAADYDGSRTYGTTINLANVIAEPENAVANGEPYNALRLLNERWWGPIKVTAHWGWSAVPDAVKQATIIEARRLYARRDAPFGVTDTPDWAGAVMRTRLDAHSELLLSPYRKMLAGVAI